jgi:LysM repeat protein
MAEYTVKAGDSLWKIAAETLGSGARWREIAAANGLDPNTYGTKWAIRPGQKLSTGAEPAPAPAPAPEAPAPATDAAPAPAPAPAEEAQAINRVQNEVDRLRDELEQQRRESEEARQQAQRNVYRDLSNYLADIGLGSLFTVTSDGRPSGWLWDQVKSGLSSQSQLDFALRQTPQFQERFGVIIEQQRRAGSGDYVGPVMSPGEVLAYEQGASTIMRRAGLPASFYDNPQDFQNLILEQVDLEELGQRVEQAYESIIDAPVEVREAFSDYFGVDRTDAALAAYVLDPDLLMRDLERNRLAAVAGGYGARYDIALSRASALEIGGQLSEQDIRNRMAQVGSMEPLFIESVGEAVDLSAQEQGVAAQFGDVIDTDVSQTEALTQLERRQIRRRASQVDAGGGAVVTGAGVTGLGMG